VKILFHTINYIPELTGIGKFSGEMGSWFAEQGHDVRVVTTPPYYPEWKIRAGYRKYWYAREMIKGAKVIRCPFWVPEHPTGLKRILHLASFSLSAFPVLLYQSVFWRPDVVCVVKPPAFSLPTAKLAAMLGGARSWLHVQDLEVDAAFTMGILKGKWLRKIVLGLESWLMRRFDLVTTISDRMLEKIKGKGIVAEKSTLFPNWVDTSAIFPGEHPSVYRSELAILPGTMVALYSGNMGEKQGLETLIDAARHLRGEARIQFVLCGEGAVRAQLEKDAQDLDNVTFLPLQPLERLNDFFNMADVHLLPQRADAADLMMPSKLGGMLASGRPVIAGALPGTEVAQAVEGAGIVVPPDDGEAFAVALRELADAQGRRAALGRAARQRALDFWDRDKILNACERRLIELCQK
jgi:colanic acid biosynthesis glycosyl transferase WcaI